MQNVYIEEHVRAFIYKNKNHAHCCDTLETSISLQEKLSNKITSFLDIKKIPLTSFRVERLGKFLPVLWRNGNTQHQNYKSPETFWSYVRIEAFPFSGKILMFAMKGREFSRLVFQVIGIFSRKQIPFEEFCLMGGLIIFSCSMKRAGGRKSCSLP